MLTNLEIERSGGKTSAEWKSGLLDKVRQFDGGEFAIAYHAHGKHSGLPRQITSPNSLVITYKYDETNRLTQVGMGDESRLTLDYDDKGRLTAWNYSPAKK